MDNQHHPTEKTAQGYVQPKRPKAPTWAIITTVILVIFVGGCGAVYYLVKGVLGINPINTMAGGSPFTEPANVHLGTPYAWRDIVPNKFRSPRFAKRLELLDFTVGDVDGDGDEEIIADNRIGNCFYLIEVNGSSLSRNEDHLGMLADFTWDYDGDGVRDIIFSNYGMTECNAYNFKFEHLGTIQGTIPTLGKTKADCDGNGFDELILKDSNMLRQDSVTVYSQGGVALWHGTVTAGLYNPTFGDIDGDSQAEMIILDMSNQTLITKGIDNLVTTYPGWSTHHWPTSCIDIDKDGCNEVFASNHGYLNLVTGKYTQLNYPKPGFPTSKDPSEKILYADLDRDGKKELITIGMDSHVFNSGLFVFDISGNAIYYEEMGDPIESYFIVREANGAEHLVVHTDRKLLMYP